jgi:hypothetical protein
MDTKLYSLAEWFLLNNLKEGDTVSIPSLEMTIPIDSQFFIKRRTEHLDVYFEEARKIKEEEVSKILE